MNAMTIISVVITILFLGILYWRIYNILRGSKLPQSVRKSVAAGTESRIPSTVIIRPERPVSL